MLCALHDCLVQTSCLLLVLLVYRRGTDPTRIKPKSKRARAQNKKCYSCLFGREPGCDDNDKLSSSPSIQKVDCPPSSFCTVRSDPDVAGGKWGRECVSGGANIISPLLDLFDRKWPTGASSVCGISPYNHGKICFCRTDLCNSFLGTDPDVSTLFSGKGYGFINNAGKPVYYDPNNKPTDAPNWGPIIPGASGGGGSGSGSGGGSSGSSGSGAAGSGAGTSGGGAAGGGSGSGGAGSAVGESGTGGGGGDGTGGGADGSSDGTGSGGQGAGSKGTGGSGSAGGSGKAPGSGDGTGDGTAGDGGGSSNTMMIVGIAAGLLVIGGAVGGYMYYRNQQKKKKEEEEDEEEEEED
ncbi:TATA-binding protein-associated factor 2N-like isoform X4 [Paramacrobiotus metropolitanus]|uniref:TATA-binding protein-associated factor 2N-like isoform X4 n=1 Tax=Paramacrobiotus metropolitanus TaxID=2943436 RepID=UPI0024460C21|nr:TATA-binding protein-associated factor 2N-like isoform X4 [Paramacrobiotus metropolitanus]